MAQNLSRINDWNNVALNASHESLLRRVNVRLSELQDPDLGFVGRSFLKKFKASECVEASKKCEGLNAFFQPFGGPRRQYFVNQIHYNPDRCNDVSVLFSHKVHEGVHALQMANTAALFSRPESPVSSFVLAPQDFLLLKYYGELDAYSKQFWLSALADGQFDDVSIQRVPVAVDAEVFEVKRRKFDALSEAIGTLGVDAMESKVHVEGQGGVATLARFYFQRFMVKYSMHLNNLRGKAIGFVRLDNHDIWEMGNTIGPNLFGLDTGRSNLLDLDHLPVHVQRWVRSTNDTLQLNRDRLPTLRQALAVSGFKSPGYVRQSRKNIYEEPLEYTF